MLPEGLDCEDLLDRLKEGVCLIDESGSIVFWNEGAVAITGYSKSEALGKASADRVLVFLERNGRRLPPAEEPLTKALGMGQAEETDLCVLHKSGRRVPVRAWFSPMREQDGAAAGAAVVINDKTPRRALLERIAELEKLALVDPLTGLSNRRRSQDHLRLCLDEWERYGWPFGVLMIDIDHFKPVNDIHGHATGDETLKMVANVLQSNLRSFDHVGRWGGEEFLVVTMNVNAYYIQTLANRICRLVKEARVVSETAQSVSVTISIGATLPRPGDTVPTLVERADAMMYKSKAEGRDRVSFCE